MGLVVLTGRASARHASAVNSVENKSVASLVLNLQHMGEARLLDVAIRHRCVVTERCRQITARY